MLDTPITGDDLSKWLEAVALAICKGDPARPDPFEEVMIQPLDGWLEELPEFYSPPYPGPRWRRYLGQANRVFSLIYDNNPAIPKAA